MLLVPTVFLVDPDSHFIQSCRKLLEPHGIHVANFDSPPNFFEGAKKTSIGCIVSELQFYGGNGIEFCYRLAHEGWTLPFLIHTAFGDVSKCSRAFKAGATDFLEKTIPPDFLLRRVFETLEKCCESQVALERKQFVHAGLEALTDREREVAHALISGNSMKEISNDCGTSFQSVARHRKRILQKFGVDNDVTLANLLRDLHWTMITVKSGFDNSLATVHD
ncbi:MAG: response regulator [Pirellulaceae bacterium]|nr:response regulator [Pirellulaceae bacterium]